MNLTQLANPRILEQPIYLPGKPIEDVAREHNLAIQDVCKLASNENPWGASPKAIQAGCDALKNVHLYPEGSGFELRKKISSFHNLKSEQIILGNGSNEIIELLGHVFLNDGDEVIFGEHAFVIYKLTALLMGAVPVSVPMPNLVHDLDLIKNAISKKTKLIFLPSPNNPTGTANSSEEIISFASSLPEDVIFCLDEAYAEYLEEPPDLRPLIDQGRKIIAMRTFSKIHGLAGLRIGYLVLKPELADQLFGDYSVYRRPNIMAQTNVLAVSAASEALKDEDFYKFSLNKANEEKDKIYKLLDYLNLKYIKSSTNFVFFESKKHINELSEQMLEKGVMVGRPFPPFYDWCRISTGTSEEVDVFMQAMLEVYG